MRPFHVCMHDGTPAYASESAVILRDLEPLVGQRFSVGVVPNWHGEWPLASHPAYCRLVDGASEELLLHGYFHRRRRGWGPTAVFAGCCDEMNGLDAEETVRTLERGQRVLGEVFGRRARGFLPPAWQAGHARPGSGAMPGFEHVLGFLSLESCSGGGVPLATWTWDCGRWRWLGHVGHGTGSLLYNLGRRVPTLAIHPRDVRRGFWPRIRRLIAWLLNEGYEPSTLTGLLEARC